MKQAFDEGKIPWNLLQEQAHLLIGIAESSLSEPRESSAGITKEDIEWLLTLREGSVSYDFNSYLGGDVFVCETPEDLSQAEGFNASFPDTHGGRWPNLNDMALSGDICDYVQGEPKFIIFIICWNNAGGPAYYIPYNLWTDNVINSVKLTNRYRDMNAIGIYQ